MIPVIPLSGYTLDISFVRGEAIIVKVLFKCPHQFKYLLYHLKCETSM